MAHHAEAQPRIWLRDELAACGVFVATKCQKKLDNYQRALQQFNGEPLRTQEAGQAYNDCLAKSCVRRLLCC
jgi:hypothetical protein